MEYFYYESSKCGKHILDIVDNDIYEVLSRNSRDSAALKYECRAWLKENMAHEYFFDEGALVIFFESKDDAMKFKMTWA